MNDLVLHSFFHHVKEARVGGGQLMGAVSNIPKAKMPKLPMPRMAGIKKPGLRMANPFRVNWKKLASLKGLAHGALGTAAVAGTVGTAGVAAKSAIDGAKSVRAAPVGAARPGAQSTRAAGRYVANSPYGMVARGSHKLLGG